MPPLLRSPVLTDFDAYVGSFTRRPALTQAYVFLRDFLAALSGASTLAAQSPHLSHLVFTNEPYQPLALSMRQASGGAYRLSLSQFQSESPSSPFALHLEFLLQPDAFGELASATVQSYRNDCSGVATSISGSAAEDVALLAIFADSFLSDLASQQFLPAAHDFAATSLPVHRSA